MKRSSGCAAVIVLAVLAGCSSDGDQGESGSTPAVSAVASLPSTSGASTSSAALTTEVPSAAWRSIELGALAGHQAVPPCCASDWYGVPSPPLPADGGPLLDGEYYIRAEWPAEIGDVIELEVYRFESCSELPEGTCEVPEDPEALGVDRSYYVALTVPLDDSTGVVLSGFSGLRGDSIVTAAMGTGTALAHLAQAVEQAYADVFAARLDAGEFAPDIVDDVRAHPVAGFGPAEGAEGVVYEAYGAPPLLFQSPFAYTEPPSPIRGSDVLYLTSLSIADGRPTLYVYAGFYS
jgi:hypothetical protein